MVVAGLFIALVTYNVLLVALYVCLFPPQRWEMAIEKLWLLAIVAVAGDGIIFLLFFRYMGWA